MLQNGLFTVLLVTVVCLLALSSAAEASVREQSTTMLCECQNGGVPEQDQAGNCACTCPAVPKKAGTTFFSGPQCATPSTYCDDNGFYCSNSGNCVPSGKDWACLCPRPFYGVRCLSEGEDCGPELMCANGGACISDPTFHPRKICRCPPGYSGRGCEIFSMSALLEGDGVKKGVAADSSGGGEGRVQWYIIAATVAGVVVSVSAFAIGLKLYYTSRARRNGSSQYKDVLEIAELLDSPGRNSPSPSRGGGPHSPYPKPPLPKTPRTPFKRMSLQIEIPEPQSPAVRLQPPAIKLGLPEVQISEEKKQEFTTKKPVEEDPPSSFQDGSEESRYITTSAKAWYQHTSRASMMSSPVVSGRSPRRSSLTIDVSEADSPHSGHSDIFGEVFSPLGLVRANSMPAPWGEGGDTVGPERVPVWNNPKDEVSVVVRP